MAHFPRRLRTDAEVERFVDGILCIEDDDLKRDAINSITQAERNIADYPEYPTLTHCDNRDFNYRDNKIRKKLREQIVTELYSNPRLKNDDDIKLGSGGAAPMSAVLAERKAFYIIGPPAAGKSGVASKIADKFGCYILDSDFAKRKLPEYTNQIGSASLVHEESDELIFSSQIGLGIKCFQNGINVVIPKIGHKLDSIISYAHTLKEKNYQVYLISVDLDRQKATQRAYNRFRETKRYVPLSLIFDAYGNQPTLNYFKIKQFHHDTFSGFAQISTDVSFGDPVKLIETENLDELKTINWR